MEKRNGLILKKAALAVVLLPAFEYELFSVNIGTKSEIFFLKSARWLIRSRNVERQVTNLPPGIFLHPF